MNTQCKECMMWYDNPKLCQYCHLTPQYTWTDEQTEPKKMINFNTPTKNYKYSYFQSLGSYILKYSNNNILLVTHTML